MPVIVLATQESPDVRVREAASRVAWALQGFGRVPEDFEERAAPQNNLTRSRSEARIPAVTDSLCYDGVNCLANTVTNSWKL
jgi:hypothetical protein